MQKKDFILALVQALFPGHKLEYYARKGITRVVVTQPRHTYGDVILDIKCTNIYDGQKLTLTAPDQECKWEDSSVETVRRFLDKQCGLDCGENDIWIKNQNSLLMYFEDYPWHLVDKIKPLEQSPTKEEVQALQAEIQQLKAENERLKAQTYTIEIPQGVTSICLNLKG